MKLSYYLLDPTGNITILVETPVERAMQPPVAAALLAAEPGAEQVGFLEVPGDACHIRVRMAGGEFCGNATLSAAALYGAEHGVPAGGTVRVGISGADAPLTVTLRQADGQFEGVVDMPPPVSVTQREFSLDGQSFLLPAVAFPGITHLLVAQPLAPADAERAVKLWCRELAAPGLGLMLLDEGKLSLRPLVYIPGADTLCWERSCASGTAAVGAALAFRRGGSVRLSLREPGGELKVEAGVQAGTQAGDQAGGKLVLKLGGRVRLLGRKEGKFTV